MDKKSFKMAMAHFATGVAVVGTMGEGGPVGMTVTAFSSLSLHPPLVLVCIDRRVYIHDRLQRSAAFSVSVLAQDQIEWGKLFAGQLTDPPPHARYRDIAYLTAQSGAPILPDCLAWVDCELYATYDGGDHSIFVGRVLSVGTERGRAPLLYFKQQWAALPEG